MTSGQMQQRPAPDMPHNIGPALYSIGDLAREFNVSLRTLRFYEDRGLLNPKREGVHRLYDGRERTQLQIILKGKRLGFTLAEIREMCGEISSRPGVQTLQLSGDQVQAQIAHLEQQKLEIELALSELRREISAEKIQPGERAA